MAGRREKLRRVGIIPEYRGFTPDGLASGDAIDMTVDELEVLRLCDWNVTRAAKVTGLSRATLNRRIREQDLHRPGKAARRPVH